MLTLNHSPVHSDPQVMGGTVVFKGTRVPAQTLFDYVDHGCTLEMFYEDFPSVSPYDAVEFIRLTREEHHF
jgi:uncharacterized protein (DUF433 family)